MNPAIMDRLDRQTWLTGFLTFAAFCFLTWSPALGQSTDPGTKPENALRIALHIGAQPLSWQTGDGRPVGILVDIWNLWANKTGRNVEFLASNWPQTIQALRDGKADVHAGLFKSDKRAEWMGFSRSIYSLNVGLFARTSASPPPTMKSLKGRRVGIVRKSVQESFVRDQHPGVIPVLFDSAGETVQATANGDVEAFFAAPTLMSIRLGNMGLADKLKPTGEILYSGRFVAAVQKGRTKLLEAIDRGFSRITIDELAQIEARWIPDPGNRYFQPASVELKLTPKERRWLADHKNIRLGVDPAYPPFDFIAEDGTYSGMASDYARIVGERLGITMDVVPGLLWGQVIDGVKSGAVDVLPAVTKTSEREKFMNFSKEYLNFPDVIFMRNDHDLVAGLGDMKGRQVAVVQGYATTKHIEALPSHRVAVR